MPPAPCGAVERVWHGLAEQFSGRGHVVKVLCRRHPGQCAEEVVNGVHLIRKTAFSQSRSLAVNLIKDMIYSSRMLTALPRADILVTNSFWLPALATWFGRRAGRVAVHVARMPKGQLFLYDSVCRLHAVSQAVRDEIARQRPCLVDKVRVIPYPIHTEVFTPPARRSEGGPLTILYAGRIHPEKGIDLLLDAFGKLAQRSFPARLRIVGAWQVERGGGGGTFLDALRQKARGLPVEFSEAIHDRHELAAVYRQADLFCYPSLAEQGETFGVAPLEAMATGLVPVVSDLACFRDFIKDGCTGAVFNHRSPDAADQLARSLSNLLSDQEQRTRMGHEAAARAAFFSYERVADLYLTDFVEMLAP
jgi:glycosyltransferase involved in cell wall biosynthesis